MISAMGGATMAWLSASFLVEVLGASKKPELWLEMALRHFLDPKNMQNEARFETWVLGWGPGFTLSGTVLGAWR